MEQELTAIYQIEGDIEHLTLALKEFELDLRERLEELPEYTALKTAQKAVKQARAELRRRISEEGKIVAAQENVAKVRSDLKDTKDILSYHLIRHYNDLGDRLPDRDNPDKSEDIIISAKLGRSRK